MHFGKHKIFDKQKIKLEKQIADEDYNRLRNSDLNLRVFKYSLKEELVIESQCLLHCAKNSSKFYVSENFKIRYKSLKWVIIKFAD